MKRNKNWEKWAKIAILGLLAAILLLFAIIPASEIILGHAGNFLLAYVEEHPLGTSVLALVVGGICYLVYQSYKAPDDGGDDAKIMPQPTAQDYFKVLETIRPAVAEVASALGLAPINGHTDMAADGPERILRWGKVWGFKYKALKQAATRDIDVEQVRRVIQAQVRTILDRDNPSRLTETNFNYYGQLVPVIQISDVEDGDAYIYIYVVMASDTYFKQVEAEKRASTLHTKSDTDDTDF